MNVLFFGTPQIAVPFLEWLIENETVVGVVTKQDEPVGRGQKITPPPVKVVAESKNIPVFQPEGPWDEEKVKRLKDFGADVGVAVAYGRLMPEPVFNAPRLGTFNIHFSLLPKYRGAGPLQWSLINGDHETGVTAFWIEEGMDSGPIFLQKKIDVDNEDDAVSLREKLVKLGIEVTAEVMKDLNSGNVVKTPQEGNPVKAPMLKKEDGRINWGDAATAIQNRIRGVVEWPGAFTFYRPNGGEVRQLKIFKAGVMIQKAPGTPGTIVGADPKEGIIVQTGVGDLALHEVQPEGKKRMPAWAFWQGAHLSVGDKFEDKK